MSTNVRPLWVGLKVNASLISVKTLIDSSNFWVSILLSIFSSVVTVPVQLVTGVQALLALSLYAMLKLTAPRVSLASAV